MARINAAERTIAATLIVAGPRQAGKTALLRTLTRRVPPARLRAGTGQDAALDPLLDWVSLHLGRIGGWDVAVDLYAVSGSPRFEHTRRLLLAEADGLLMVADAQAVRLDDNLATLRGLREELLDREGAPRDVPMVFCWSKADLPEELRVAPAALTAALNARGAPAFEASLLRGDGILEALHALVTLVLRRLGPGRVAGGV
jgi:signal recognition particle receptor subunit beta